MKKIICALSLLSCAAYASSGTMVITYSGNSVQCNDWGWTAPMLRTYWKDFVCAPLQVKTRSGEVLSVPTTDVCGGTGVAVYNYDEGNTEVSFMGCRDL